MSLAGTASSLGTAVVKFVADGSAFSKGLTKMQTGLGKFGESVSKAGAAMTSMGTKGLLAFGTISGAIGLTIKKAMDFEKGFAEVRTMMGGAADVEVAKLRTGILDLSMQYGTTLPAALKASYDALSAGVPNENLNTFLQTAAKSAAAGVTEISTTTDVLTTIVNSYGEQLAGLGD